MKEVDADLRRLRGAVYRLAHLDDVFWQVRAIVEGNPAINPGGVFPDWIVQCYADAMVVGLRRLTDRRRDVISLVRLLARVQERAPEFTRRWFVELHAEPLRQQADEWFTEIAGGEHPQLPRAAVQQKQEDLKAALTSVEAFANQYVAHAAAQPKARLTLEDVRQGVVSAFRTLQWLRRLVSSGVITTPVPRIQTNWLRDLRAAWLAPDAPAPAYVHLDELLS